MSLASDILEFYFSLPKLDPPGNVEIIYPYENDETRRVMELFYKKYYADENPRIPLFGINPGRFGAGVTGVAFTDPILLEERCGIANSLEKRAEMSASFICEVIDAYGGEEKFYATFFLTTVLPFGLLKDGKNYNYYDDATTLQFFRPFIERCVSQQYRFLHAKAQTAVIGRGKNLSFFRVLNEERTLFDTIYDLPHPRWVMQYRRKEKKRYIDEYLHVLERLEKEMDNR